MREMKDSGIGWVHNIPAFWDVIKGKYVLASNKLIVGAKVEEYDRLALTLNGVIKRSKDDNEGLQPVKFDTYQILKKDELVFKLIDLQNISTSRVGLSPYIGIVSPAYIILKCSKKIYPQFAEKYYLMMWMNQVFNALGGSGVRSSLNSSELLELLIPLPPIDEQKKIAKYLDEQCKKIDEIIADIQKQIDTLEDYKKSVISEAVTMGLNPNTKITKSRIFYMAPYNKEWTLTKIGYCCKKLWRAFAPEDTALICTNKGKVSVRPEEMTGKMVSEDNAMQGIKKGDIAIHGMDTWHGSVAYSDYDGKITRVVHVCDSTEDKRFIVYYLQQLAFNGVYKLISNGIRGNTSDFRSWDKVADIYIALPKVDEQHQISDYLDKKCAEIDSIIENKKAQLETIENYKKSLIYEYVTGKKEVPENE
jgi:type I restriction enzyme S subunit